ncbi:MAG: pyridoxal-phosphate dependent enzyme [Gemmatimonadetes bacterium]|nr:pyridoxal-phosphate dependent enzyme [Gemmatimonadota bacterium]
MPELEHLQEAQARISGSLHRTPVVSSRTLSERVGRPVFLKCENLQKTGSFKVRGALNLILELDDVARGPGVVTISAGNHAQAVAWSAARAGISATVVMPANASPTKVRASEEYGAEVILQGTIFEAFDLALEVAQDRGLTFLHAFDDPLIIAGQGTVGLEILEDVPDVATVVAPVGGGGLISGVALAVASLAPGARVFGVEPHGACAMRKSLDKGEAVHLESIDTIADGLGAPMAGELTFEVVRHHVEDVVLVSDDEIREAMAFVLERAKLLVEPAGAAGVAALLAGRIPLADGPVVAVLSGGNVDLDRLPDLLGTPGG